MILQKVGYYLLSDREFILEEFGFQENTELLLRLELHVRKCC